jgi:hypothetical protein
MNNLTISTTARKGSRSSSQERAETPSDPFVRANSLKALKVEQDRIKAEEDAKEQEKEQKRAKSAQKKVRCFPFIPYKMKVKLCVGLFKAAFSPSCCGLID